MGRQASKWGDMIIEKPLLLSPSSLAWLGGEQLPQLNRDLPIGENPKAWDSM